MKTYDEFIHMLNRSKEYEFDNHTTLVIRDYYTGDTVRLDLSKLTPEMYEAIAKDEPKRAIWLRCNANIDGWEERAAAALGSIDRNRRSFEQADHELYNEIQREIEEYYHDEDIDPCEWEVIPDEILWYMDE